MINNYENDRIKFFNKEFKVITSLIIGVPIIVLFIFYLVGFLEWGVALAGALFGSFFTFLGSHYTNYQNQNQFIEEKKHSKNLLYEEINLEKKRNSNIEMNKKITKIFTNSDIFKKGIPLQELVTLDDVVIFFYEFERNIYYEEYYGYDENYYEYLISCVGEDIYKFFKEEIKNLDKILFLSNVLKEEIVCWANNYEMIISCKKDLRDRVNYKRYDDYYYYPINMAYKALYYDLKIICAIIWRDTNAYLFNNINLTTRNEINELFGEAVSDSEMIKYTVTNYHEETEEEDCFKTEFNIGESFIVKDIYKTLFKDLYAQFEPKIMDVESNSEIELDEREDEIEIDEKYVPAIEKIVEDKLEKIKREK